MRYQFLVDGVVVPHRASMVSPVPAGSVTHELEVLVRDSVGDAAPARDTLDTHVVAAVRIIPYRVNGFAQVVRAVAPLTAQENEDVGTSERAALEVAAGLSDFTRSLLFGSSLEVRIAPRGKRVSDVPEFQDAPLTTSGASRVVGFAKSRMVGRSWVAAVEGGRDVQGAITTHELGHLVRFFGMAHKVGEIQRAFDTATEFVSDYARTDAEEYWAVATQARFGVSGDTRGNPRFSPYWLSIHDPALHRLLCETFPATTHSPC
ncbi:hypothetical protein ACGFZG_35095 [Streptomyces antibioticus]|uniref:hypothetical protein n=1 Tax=Streptomyces antibioticus TaxID=1890 RepID=UPI00196188DF|nr:hypothetical protein [Streptomyces sp. S9]